MFLKITFKILCSVLVTVLASMATTYDLKLITLPNDVALVAGIGLIVIIFGLGLFALGKIWRKEIEEYL